MSGLLPHALRHVVASKSTFAASESFGLVALVLLVVLLVEVELLRVARGRAIRALAVYVVPLLVAVTLTIAARLAEIFK